MAVSMLRLPEGEFPFPLYVVAGPSPSGPGEPPRLGFAKMLIENGAAVPPAPPMSVLALFATQDLALAFVRKYKLENFGAGAYQTPETLFGLLQDDADERVAFEYISASGKSRLAAPTVPAFLQALRDAAERTTGG